MKTALLSLLVLLLLLGQSSALRCTCGGRKKCAGNTDTCGSEENYCGITWFYRDSTYRKGCMSSLDCGSSNYQSSQCCNHKDFCNKDFY